MIYSPLCMKTEHFIYSTSFVWCVSLYTSVVMALLCTPGNKSSFCPERLCSEIRHFYVSGGKLF